MITVKTKISKYLIIAAVFVISLTAIYFIKNNNKNKNKNNNANGKSSFETKLSKKTGQDIYFDAQNISVKYRDIEGKEYIERNLSKEEREKVINYFKNAEFKILEGGSKYKSEFIASLSFDNRFEINFSPENKGLYAIYFGNNDSLQLKDESSENKAYDILKPLVKR